MLRLRRLGTKLALLAAAILTIGGLSLGLVGSASASGPYLYANSGSPKVCGQIGCSTFGYVRNGTSFAMNCWTDSSWYNENYWTNRWFYGLAYTSIGNYWQWVPASEVANQVNVPHC